MAALEKEIGVLNKEILSLNEENDEIMREMKDLRRRLALSIPKDEMIEVLKRIRVVLGECKL